MSTELNCFCITCNKNWKKLKMEKIKELNLNTVELEKQENVAGQDMI